MAWSMKPVKNWSMLEVAPDYFANPTKVRMLMLSGVIE
jgi:hypothetical protein